MQEPEFSNNAAAHQYELKLDGGVAGYAVYEEQSGRVRFTHTVVEPQHEGKGLGSKLAKQALDDVRQRGLKAVPQCRFIAAYIERHPEYSDLVAG
ncbi:GNAT family N-acetyltransferase [Ramlibacter sp.]|uniref:GNAT family N-acetyltransferase n=1 Tax=Ramlibacter sp. TaxID=1917967 RepID=UPI0017C4397F|nr:GNAT family N-acetyltransferase [Ramlibacter sp.]MBA2673721.1 N-acetyltransferase [Ramlibacter sp.]